MTNQIIDTDARLSELISMIEGLDSSTEAPDEYLQKHRAEFSRAITETINNRHYDTEENVIARFRRRITSTIELNVEARFEGLRTWLVSSKIDGLSSDLRNLEQNRRETQRTISALQAENKRLKQRIIELQATAPLRPADPAAFIVKDLTLNPVPSNANLGAKIYNFLNSFYFYITQDALNISTYTDRQELSDRICALEPAPDTFLSAHLLSYRTYVVYGVLIGMITPANTELTMQELEDIFLPPVGAAPVVTQEPQAASSPVVVPVYRDDSPSPVYAYSLYEAHPTMPRLTGVHEDTQCFISTRVAMEVSFDRMEAFINAINSSGRSPNTRHYEEEATGVDSADTMRFSTHDVQGQRIAYINQYREALPASSDINSWFTLQPAATQNAEPS
jgi:hypothetical protein